MVRASPGGDSSRRTATAGRPRVNGYQRPSLRNNGPTVLTNGSGGAVASASKLHGLREATTRGPHGGRRDRAEPLAGPTRFARRHEP